MVLTLENITYIYNLGQAIQRKALESINLTVDAGDFLGIAGATGSGKSTLIQHFNGILKPTSGRVLFKGYDIWTGGDIIEVRSKIGLLFQYPEQQLFAEQVGEDVAFGPRNLGFDEGTVKIRVCKALEKVGLDPVNYLARNPFALSGGEKRKVALAGVLAMEPEILVLDEPTAGLDARGKEALFQLLADLNRQGITIIMVSHSMEDLARLAKRLVVLKQGEIYLEGTPQEVFNQVQGIREAGLTVPLITELMVRLNKIGAGVDTAAVTPQAALKELCRLLGREKHA